MPAISAAKTHNVNTIDIEAQTQTANRHQASNSTRTTLKRTAFALCNFGLACGLIQATRSQNQIMHQPSVRHLQANNATAIPTPEPEPEACPKNYFRFDKERAINRDMTALKVTGGMLGASPLLFGAGTILNNECIGGTLIGVGALSGIGGFVGLVISGIFLGSDKSKVDGRCYEKAQGWFDG